MGERRSPGIWRIGAFAGLAAALAYMPPAGVTAASAAEAAQAPLQYVTCNGAGGPFVMGDSDFAALASPDARGGGPALTRQYFISLKLTSPLRLQICDSRGLLRAIRKLGPDHCTTRFLKGFPHWLPQFFSESEQKELLDCQINAATE